MDIFIEKKYVTGAKALSEKALTCYLALKQIYNNGKESNYYVSMNMLCYQLFGKYIQNGYKRHFIDDLQIGLNELINNNIISYVDVISKREFILDLSHLYLDTKKSKENKEYFSVLNDTDIHKIMNNCKAEKFKVCRYFIYLVGTFVKVPYKDKSYKAGFMKIEYMADKLNITSKSVIKYNAILEDNNVIAIYKAKFNMRNKTTGEINGITNTYGFYDDKDIIMQIGKDHEIEYGYDKDTKKIIKAKGNLTRSWVAKFNCFCNGKQYDEEQLKQMYFVIRDLNKRNLEKYGKDNENNHLKDLSLFKDYDFYVDEDSVEPSSPKVENEPAPQNSAKVQVIHKTENEDNSEDDEVSEEDYKNYLDSMVEIDIDTLDDDD